MGKTRILALDLGDAVSWATRARDGGAVSGASDFKSKMTESSGFRALRFRNHLVELCNEATVEVIVYLESRSAAHAEWLLRLKEFSQRTNTPLQGVSSGAVKKHTAGIGNASKEAVLAAIVALNYTPGTADEAMALATLRYAEFERLRKGEAA